MEGCDVPPLGVALRQVETLIETNRKSDLAGAPIHP
jgi:hypothetical protein